MSWWCAASSAPWSWTWRPYPGVWLFLLVLIGLYWRFAARPEGRLPFAAGIALLWVALDWPVGALGGYLATAHSAQFILLAIAAAPFLLVGLRAWLGELADRSPRAASALRVLAHPLTGLIGFNLILFGTHVPGLVDGLMTTQLGSFAIDLAWILAGGFLWFPGFAPPAAQRVTPPVLMGYLFLQTIPSTVPAAFLVFSEFPLFKLYELAPRVTELLTPANDHQVAGLIMKTVGDPVIWVGMAVVFFRWANAEKRADLAERGLPKVAPSA